MAVRIGPIPSHLIASPIIGLILDQFPHNAPTQRSGCKPMLETHTSIEEQTTLEDGGVHSRRSRTPVLRCFGELVQRFDRGEIHVFDASRADELHPIEEVVVGG